MYWEVNFRAFNIYVLPKFLIYTMLQSNYLGILNSCGSDLKKKLTKAFYILAGHISSIVFLALEFLWFKYHELMTTKLRSNEI